MIPDIITSDRHVPTFQQQKEIKSPKKDSSLPRGVSTQIVVRDGFKYTYYQATWREDRKAKAKCFPTKEEAIEWRKKMTE